MKEISNILEFKELLESNQISKVFIQIIEDVYGYYQLKEGFISDDEQLQGEDWNELEGSPTDVGNYNSDKPIYRGKFNISNQHEVNLDWFREKINGFIESDFFEEEDPFSFDCNFFDYGLEEGGFDYNSEMGLGGFGLNYNDIKKSMKIILSTYKENNNVETGLVFESDGDEVIWTFETV